MKMYAFASSPNCWKVLAVARELSLPIETIPIDLFKGEAKSPAFLAKNPNGRVPVLEEDGFVLWESNAILGYLASRQPIRSLLPMKPRERAEVDPVREPLCLEGSHERAREREEDNGRRAGDHALSGDDALE